MKLKKMLLLFFITTILITCKHDVYNTDVCFQQNVLPIFISKCSMIGCHNGNGSRGKNYTNYDGIMKDVVANHPLRSSVYTAIRGYNPSMPRGGKLTAKEISYIKIWIDMGAHNTSNCETCDTTSYNYTNTIKPLLTTWCVGCHSASNSGGGYDFSVYSGVVKSITNNRLLGSIQQLSGYSAMPQGNKMSDCDIQLITKWIQSGYPNN